MTKEEKHKRIAVIALATANELQASSAYAGSFDDGGAGRLRKIVHAWVAGLEGEIPEELRRYEKIAELTEDLDWEVYCRLKAKFEGF